MTVDIVGGRCMIPSPHDREVALENHLRRFTDRINDSRIEEGLPLLDYNVIVECNELARLGTDEARARIDELLDS